MWQLWYSFWCFLNNLNILWKTGPPFCKTCYSYLSNSIYRRDFTFLFHFSSLIVSRKIKYRNSCLDVPRASKLHQVSFVQNDRLGEKYYQSCNDKNIKINKESQVCESFSWFCNLNTFHHFICCYYQFRKDSW